MQEASNLHTSGIAAAREGRLTEARDFLLRALHAGAPPGPVLRNLTEINRRLGRHMEAISAGEEAVRLLGRDTQALLNLALALSDSGNDDASLACLDDVLAGAPDTAAAHLARGEILLRQGDYEAGWAEYAWRARLPGVPPLIPPSSRTFAGAIPWNGAPIDTALLIVADQGYGDMFQFARLLPWAAAQCGRLVVHAPADVVTILEQIPGVAACASDWGHLGAAAAWCALSDLPRLANAGWMQAAAPVPYLAAPEAGRAKWWPILNEMSPPRAGRLRAGLVWAGSPLQSNDFARSAPLRALTPLAGIASIAWISLQKGQAAAQREGWPTSLPDAGAYLHDFAAAMALISLLDLIVTVDTSVAHLAGAMGRPVWIMLAHRADWRWGEHPSQTWWYPSAQLFRQAIPGDWDGVAQNITKAG